MDIANRNISAASWTRSSRRSRAAFALRRARISAFAIAARSARRPLRGRLISERRCALARLKGLQASEPFHGSERRSIPFSIYAFLIGGIGAETGACGLPIGCSFLRSSQGVGCSQVTKKSPSKDFSSVDRSIRHATFLIPPYFTSLSALPVAKRAANTISNQSK